MDMDKERNKNINIEKTEGMTRREALRRMCCGAAMAAVASTLAGPALQSCKDEKMFVIEANRREDLRFTFMWMHAMMGSIDKQCAGSNKLEANARDAMRQASRMCYDYKKLDDVVPKYDLNRYIEELKRELDWEFEFESDTVFYLYANKTGKCQCPLARTLQGSIGGALCVCSETMMERTFSRAYGGRVRVELLESYLRGGNRCIYRIRLC